MRELVSQVRVSIYHLLASLTLWSETIIIQEEMTTGDSSIYELRTNYSASVSLLYKLKPASTECLESLGR